MKKLKIGAIVIVCVIVGLIFVSKAYVKHEEHLKGLNMIGLVLDTPVGIIVMHNIHFPENAKIMRDTVKNFEPKNYNQQILQIQALEKLREAMEETILFLEELKNEQQQIPDPPSTKEKTALAT
jgi:hypothetical protein